MQLNVPGQSEIPWLRLDLIKMITSDFCIVAIAGCDITNTTCLNFYYPWCLCDVTQGFLATRDVHESGGSLALRALGRGTLYAVGGFSLFCLVAWKLSGAHSV